jgi:hypothetical protein
VSFLELHVVIHVRDYIVIFPCEYTFTLRTFVENIWHHFLDQLADLVWVQGASTVSTAHLPNCHTYKTVHTKLASKFLTICCHVSKGAIDNNSKNVLSQHLFYSVNEFKNKKPVQTWPVTFVKGIVLQFMYHCIVT